MQHTFKSLLRLIKINTSAILLMIIASLFFFSCGGGAENTSTKKGISFENEQAIDNEVFYVKYPGSWKPGSGGQAKTEFVLTAPQIPNGDISRETVHLMRRDLEGKTVAEFIAMTMNQYQEEIFEFEILSAAENEFTFLGGPLENKAKYRHKFIEKDGNVYILGYSAGLNDWSTYEETARKIMETFKLK